MSFPVAAADDYFARVELKEKRGKALNVRVPVSLKADLEELAEFMTAKDRLSEGKEAIETSVGDVVVRLLKVGIEGAWTQAGLSAKPSKEEIAAKLASLKSPT